MTLLLLFFLAPIGLALLLAMLLRRWRPMWSIRRTAILSALPIPLLMLSISVISYVRVAAMLRNCATPLLGPIFLGIVSIVLFPIGLALCSLALRPAHRP